MPRVGQTFINKARNGQNWGNTQVSPLIVNLFGNTGNSLYLILATPSTCGDILDQLEVQCNAVKKIPTKADIRAELQQQVDCYTREGGEIQQIPSGISGRENPLESIKTPLFTDQKTDRTPVPEIVAALDSRKNKKTTKTKSENTRAEQTRPKEKIIYDDFGEPLRKVWVDQ